MLQFGVITLFPSMFDCLQWGVLGKALKNKQIDIQCVNPREWGLGSNQQVDDKPYGGGPGMVMMYEPLANSIIHAKQHMPKHCRTVYLSPQGSVPSQSKLKKLASENQPLLFVAGRYEGIDERVIDDFVDEQWSLGDFVISGGELAAMVFIDAISRFVPGVLGDEDSVKNDSFYHGLLDYPHYTRPEIINKKAVPSVLLSGHHKQINEWRRKQALGNTWLKRPDLLEQLVLDSESTRLLTEFKQAFVNAKDKH